MNIKEYPDWHAVVAAHWRDTVGFLYASQPGCIEIRDDELRKVRGNRVLVGVTPADLTRWKPTASWMMGVVLCPGDDVAELVAWAIKNGAAERIRFYAYPKCDPFAVLQPWADAGLPNPAVDIDIGDWKRLHRRFGRDLAVQILQDWS